MRYKRILLVNPPYTGSRVRSVFCAGLGYIAQSLESHNFEYDFLDMSLGYTYKYLRRIIERFRPDLIGISMMSHSYKETYRIIGRLKRDFSNIHIVVGGPHISLFRQKALGDCREIDYGVVLEGEEAILELCKGSRLSSIKGLIFREGNAIVYNGQKEFVRDLDSIPFPHYEKFELEKIFDKRLNALPIVSSRGCPYECIYCPVQSSIGKNFRARSPGNIIKELSYWYERGYRKFSLADDNFTFSKERVYKLCQELKDNKLRDIKFSCDNGIRADTVDRELLAAMKDVGFYRIAFGVEAGNNQILNNLKKKEDIDTIKRNIRHACDLGYDVDLFFLVGSPQETWQDLEDSFRIALDYPIGIAYFYNIIPFPHTELFTWIEKNGRFIKSPDDYLDSYPILDNEPVFEAPSMNLAMRKKALRCAFGIMRKTIRRSWAKKLSRFGFLGNIFALVYSARLFQDVLMRNKFFRRLVYKLAAAIVS